MGCRFVASFASWTGAQVARIFGALTDIYQLARPLLFRLRPDTAHRVTLASLAMFEQIEVFRDDFFQKRRAFARCPVERFGLRFPNPIGVAGGLDKNGVVPLTLGALGFGFVEVGTVTAHPQAPNASPNLFRLPKDRALINRLGFPNEGARHVAERLARKKPKMHVPLAVSIGKSRTVDANDLDAVIGDYLSSFRAVRSVADFVVVNVSSPNTKNLRSLQIGDSARRLLDAIGGENERGAARPLLLKLAPDLANEAIVELVRHTMNAGFAGIVATNTTIAREGLRTRKETVAAIGDGGLSGAPLFERAAAVVRLVRQVAGEHAWVIGVGGISSKERASAMLRAGANMLQLYTGLVYEGPKLLLDICEHLRAGG